ESDTLSLHDALPISVASHREAKTRYEQAKKDLQRIEALYAKELVTQKELDDAMTQELALDKRLSQLEAEIRLAQDQLTQSAIRADRKSTRLNSSHVK